MQVHMQVSSLPGVFLPQRARGGKSGKRTKVANVLVCGGGVQSLDLIYRCIYGEYPLPDVVIFSDTKIEGKWTYKNMHQVEKSLEPLGVPVIWAQAKHTLMDNWWSMGDRSFVRSSIPLYTLSPEGKRGRLRRQCTGDLKISCSNRMIRLWLTLKGLITLPQPWGWRPIHDLDMIRHGIGPFLTAGQWVLFNGDRPAGLDEYPRVNPSQDVCVDLWMGYTTDEDLRAQQMKKYKLPAWQRPKYPLIEMGITRDECVDHLYDLIFDKRLDLIPFKSSCVICPFHDDSHWQTLKDLEPGTFEFACRYDDWLRSPGAKNGGAYAGIVGEMSLHPSCRPLREIDFDARIQGGSGGGASEFEKEAVDGSTCGGDGGFSCDL